MPRINLIDPERKNHANGFCVWLTGLPAAGKTTIAKALQAVAVLRAEDESSPTQCPAGTRSASKASRASRYARRNRSESIMRSMVIAKCLAP